MLLRSNKKIVWNLVPSKIHTMAKNSNKLCIGQRYILGGGGGEVGPSPPLGTLLPP